MTRQRALGLAVRVAFLVAVVAFAVWSFWGDGPQIAASLTAVSPASLALSVLLSAVGLIAMLGIWRVLAAGLGLVLPRIESARVLFVSQLGKYLPGSVWSLGAQAAMTRRTSTPARTVVAIGLLLIGCMVAASLAAGSVGGLLDARPLSGLWWLWALGVLVGLAGLTPPVVNLAARLSAGTAASPAFRWRDTAAIVVLAAVLWAAWLGAGAVLLAALPGRSAGGWATLLAALAIAYAAGVVVIIAPAGIGARELVFVAFLEPVIGAGAAVALAVLTRLASTVADFGVAGLAVVVARVRSRAL